MPTESGDYTAQLELCDERGRVDGIHFDLLNALRRISGLEPYDGKPFDCTGSAHLAGEHIRCTSLAHRPVEIAPGTSVSFADAIQLGDDAMIYGAGYVLNGQRVDPRHVRAATCF